MKKNEENKSKNILKKQHIKKLPGSSKEKEKRARCRLRRCRSRFGSLSSVKTGMFNNRTGPEKMKKKWKFRNRTGPDRSIHMKMGQNMTKFDENGSKYDEI